MPGVKRNRVYAPRPRSLKRYKYTASRGSNLSNYIPSRVSRSAIRRGGSKKYRRNFVSVRRRRSSRSSRSRRGLTIAKVLKAFTPLNSASYTVAGKAQVGGSSAQGPACVYYIPNARGSTTAYSTADYGGTPTIGLGQVIINGSGTTQVFPHFSDVTELGYRISTADASTAIAAGTSFFSPSVKFYIGNYRCTTKMVNQSNSQAFVQIYTCRLRRDLPNNYQNISTLLSRGYIEKLVAQDQTGTYNVSGIGQSDNWMRDDQLNPFDSGKFLSFVKIVGTRKFIMNAGDMKTTYLVSKSMRLVKPTMYATSSIGNTWREITVDTASIKGGVFQIFKITGQPTNDSATKSLLSMTTPVIDFTHDYHYNYRFTAETGATTTRFGAVGYSAITGASVMTEQGNVVAASAAA